MKTYQQLIDVQEGFIRKLADKVTKKSYKMNDSQLSRYKASRKLYKQAGDEENRKPDDHD